MDAVMTRPRKAVKAPARPTETIPQDEARAAPGGHASGVHLVKDSERLAWPYADRDDVLEINFDVREYCGEGFYLIHHRAPPGEVTGPPGCFPFTSAYSGVRNLHRRNGQIEVLEASTEGREWRPFTADEWARTTVHGYVKNIYRRHVVGCAEGLFLVGQLAAVGEQEDGSAFAQFRHSKDRTITVSGLTPEEARALSPHFLNTMRLELKP